MIPTDLHCGSTVNAVLFYRKNNKSRKSLSPPHPFTPLFPRDLKQTFRTMSGTTWCKSSCNWIACQHCMQNKRSKKIPNIFCWSLICIWNQLYAFTLIIKNLGSRKQKIYLISWTSDVTIVKASALKSFIFFSLFPIKIMYLDDITFVL